MLFVSNYSIYMFQIVDEKQGKSYCSCLWSSSANSACPELLSVNIVKAGNRHGNTNLLGLDIPPLKANWETIAVQYRNDDYTGTDVSKTYLFIFNWFGCNF